ncbi:MAG: Ig-like domain-containing protein [Bacillota bacterium]
MNSIKKLVSIILIVTLISATLCGCSQEVEVKAETITLSQTQITLAEGETHTIYAEVSPSNAGSVTVKWTSTNEDVATVSRGTITAKDSGTAKIYATNTSGEITAVCDVVVSDDFLLVGSGYSITDAGYGSRVFATISEALAFAGEDAVIIVEEGEYNEYVNITKSVTLKGQNAVVTGAFVIGYPSLSGDVDEINIDGFAFQIGGETSLDQHAGIYIGNDCDEISITNCTFVGDFDGGEVASWNDSDITVGIYAIPSASSTGAEDLEIVSCDFENLDFAVMMLPYVASSDIKSCSFETCGFALYLAGSQKLEIENNTLSGSGLIQFGFAENLADMIEVENNIIESYPNGYLVIASEGCVDSGFTLDLSDNTFVGMTPADMTVEEFETLTRKINGIVQDGSVVNVKLASNKELKEIFG